jgi:hypothetical protein
MTVADVSLCYKLWLPSGEPMLEKAGCVESGHWWSVDQQGDGNERV